LKEGELRNEGKKIKTLEKPYAMGDSLGWEELCSEVFTNLEARVMMMSSLAAGCGLLPTVSKDGERVAR
jgi:hypothetical protein